MELRSIVILVIKLSGLYLVVNTGVELLAFLPTYISSWEDLPVLFLVSPLVSLIFGVAFWLVPSKIANTVVGKNIVSEPDDRFFYELQRVGVLLLGLYLLYTSIVFLVSSYIRESRTKELLGSVFESDSQIHLTSSVAILEIALSVALILGAKPILKFLSWAWREGQSWPPANK